MYSSQENDFIYSLLRDSNAWIGGNSVSRRWAWADGTCWCYTNWYPGEPSFDGNCLETKGGWTGRWNDRPCHYKMKAICKKGMY